MKEFLRKKLKDFWDKEHRTVYDEGGCPTCRPECYDVIDGGAFEDMLNEMDKWIDEAFND